MPADQHKIPGSKCPNCGKLLDGASGLGDAQRPAPGSISICLYCQVVTKYGDDLRLTGFTEAEAADLMADAETMALIRRAVGQIRFFTVGPN